MQLNNETFAEHACHLRPYRGGYKLIEQISGISFKNTKPNSKSVSRNGRISEYASLTRSLGDVLSLMILIIALTAIRSLNMFLPQKLVFRRGRLLSYQSYWRISGSSSTTVFFT